MPPVGFEPMISASERQQTYALDRGATGTGQICRLRDLIIYFCVQTGVDGYNFWLSKFVDGRLFWEKVGAISLQIGWTYYGVCP